MTSSRQFKIGLLVIVSLVGLVLAALGLGMQALKQPTIAYHTYFDESVQGLELGAPVKFRGVAIGTVSAIEVAPDRRRIDVTLALRNEKVARLQITPGMRAQLAMTGITGVKFVDIDFFDPATNPPPNLTFRPAANYIPAQASTLGALTRNLETVGPQVPELIDRAIATLDKLDALIADVERHNIPEHVAGTVVSLERIARRLDRARVADKTATTLDNLSATAARLRRILDRFDGDHGLVAGAQRAIDSLGRLGRATGGTGELGQTIRDVGEAARSVRALADALERDPDMLLKGRRKPRS
ncbi:MAG: MCE family protein [Deltaproteobacteria bacterium]|nr:MCE family protein [Deltaproteobacteria bacterium]